MVELKNELLSIVCSVNDETYRVDGKAIHHI